MLKCILFFYFIPIFIFGNIDYIDSVLINNNYIKYKDYIKDKELKTVLKEYIVEKALEIEDFEKIKDNINVYDKSLNSIIIKKTKNIKNIKILQYLNSLGYSIVNQEWLIKHNRINYLMKHFQNSKTDSIILSNIEKIDKNELFNYLLAYNNQVLIDTIIKIKRDERIEILHRILKKDTLNILYNNVFFDILGKINKKDIIQFYARYIPDTIYNKRLCYFKGRFYENNEELFKAKELFFKINDEEAYIRTIAKLGEKYGREFSDSLLLDDDSNYRAVLYHKAKVLLYKGKIDKANQILEKLANEKNIDYYSTRARYLLNYKTDINKKIKIKNSKYYTDIYNTFKKQNKEYLFDRYISLKYKKRKGALYYALIYEKIGIYNMQILYGHKMLNDNYSLEKSLMFIFPIPYYEQFKFASDSTNIDIALLYAMAREESWFNDKAISPVGAKGVMQLMDFVYDNYMDDKDYFNVGKNILIGALHIKEYIQLFPNNITYGIMSYNAGPFNVRKWERKSIDWELFLEMIPFRETRLFIKRILRSYYYYKSIFNES